MKNPEKKFYPVMSKAAIRLSATIRTIEMILAGLLIVSVLIVAIFLLLPYVKDTSQILQLIDYNGFQQFLSFVLILIIALELAMMLITHDHNKVIEVMIYAIARKMLIYNTTAVELLLGVLTLVVLFAAEKFLIHGHLFRHFGRQAIRDSRTAEDRSLEKGNQQKNELQ